MYSVMNASVRHEQRTTGAQRVGEFKGMLSLRCSGDAQVDLLT